MLGPSGELPEALQKVDPAMLELVCNEIVEQGGAVQWSDIAGQEQAKRLVQELVVWPMLNPHLFKVCQLSILDTELQTRKRQNRSPFEHSWLHPCYTCMTLALFDLADAPLPRYFCLGAKACNVATWLGTVDCSCTYLAGPAEPTWHACSMK